MIQTDTQTCKTFHLPNLPPFPTKTNPGSRYPQNSELALALNLLRIYWNEALHPQSPEAIAWGYREIWEKKTYPETEKNKRTVPNRSVSTALFIDQPYWVHNQQFLLWDTGFPCQKSTGFSPFTWNRFKSTSSMRQATSKTQEVKASSFRGSWFVGAVSKL